MHWLFIAYSIGRTCIQYITFLNMVTGHSGQWPCISLTDLQSVYPTHHAADAKRSLSRAKVNLSGQSEWPLLRWASDEPIDHSVIAGILSGWEAELRQKIIFDQKTESEEQTAAQIIPTTISRILSPSKNLLLRHWVKTDRKDRWMVQRMSELDGWTDEQWTNGWMDRWTNGWTDELTG